MIASSFESIQERIQTSNRFGENKKIFASVNKTAQQCIQLSKLRFLHKTNYSDHLLLCMLPSEHTFLLSVNPNLYKKRKIVIGSAPLLPKE
jgi:hypothetical protein